jgi:CHAD domain-containing protein
MESKNTNSNPEIYHFLRVQLHHLRKHFVATRAGMSVEAIHQMRVALKRIRTIHKLKKHIHFPSLLNDEQYVSLKSIFAVAGQMRDLQVQQNMLALYAEEHGVEVKEFAACIDDLEKHNAGQLKQAILAFDFKFFDILKQNPGMRAFIEENIDVEKECTEFLQLKINTINGLLLLIDRDEYVHDLRKEVKQLFFVLEFLQKYFPDSRYGAYDLKTLKETGEQLGNWNDCEVLIKRLHEFLGSEREISQQGREQCSQLIHHLENEKHKYLENIDMKLKTEIKACLLAQMSGLINTPTNDNK